MGSLQGKLIYQDSTQIPGSILESSLLPLIGKPDYLIKKKKSIIPIEIKTGKTPLTPYKNHVMQLIAYCHLVEENYGMRPTYGILKYPQKEFAIDYTSELEQALFDLVAQIQDFKLHDYGDYFVSHSFGICTKCKMELRK